MAGETRGTAPPARQPRRRVGRIRTFSSLRNRDYRFLWIGNTFNSGANWLQQLTVGWLVWDLSQSPFLVGTVGGLRAFPFLFIGPFAGVMADRFDRRKVVMVSQIILATAAFLFALLVASGQVEVWHAFVYIIVSGTAHAILQPTRAALIANTVPREDLPNAFALQSMSVTSSRFVWPAIGGVLVGAFGFTFNFFVESALYIALAFLIIPVRTPYREQSTRSHASGLADMKEGVAYVWRDKIILQLILLSFIPNLLVQPCIHLLPVFAGAVLNRGPEIFGTLLSANGIAGFTATVVIASVGYIVGKGKASLLTLVLGSIGVILLGLSHWLFLSTVAVIIIGFAGSTFRTSNNTLVQTLVPDGLRGRVQSIYHLDHGLTPLASFFIGLFAELFTPTGAVTSVGLASLVLSLYFLLAFRRVRELP